MKNRILVTLFCQKALFKSIFCLNCNEKSPLGLFTETGFIAYANLAAKNR